MWEENEYTEDSSLNYIKNRKEEIFITQKRETKENSKTETETKRYQIFNVSIHTQNSLHWTDHEKTQRTHHQTTDYN